jgi:hypothetical protein
VKALSSSPSTVKKKNKNKNKNPTLFKLYWNNEITCSFTNYEMNKGTIVVFTENGCLFVELDWTIWTAVLWQQSDLLQ